MILEKHAKGRARALLATKPSCNEHNLIVHLQTKGLPYDPPASTEVQDWALPDPAAFPELLDSVVDEIIENMKTRLG